MRVSKTRMKIYENEKVNRWYQNNSASSAISAEIWRRNLGLYCETMDITPEAILEQARNDILRNSFQDFINHMLKKGRKGAYISIHKQALQSFARFHGIDYKINLKIPNESFNETTEDEQVPRRNDVSNFLLTSGKRGRVSISLMAFSGLRPESLGNHTGTDGLILKDLEDLDLESLTFLKMPAKVNIRRSISKARNRYFSFLTEEGCRYVTEYLQERVDSGEKLTPESPLLQIDLRGAFTGKGELKERKSGHTFLRTSLVTREIKSAIRKGGLEMRPYVLRAFFATAMDRGEYGGLISHSWRQFLMGHKGDIESVYSTNKRLLPEQIEEMRQAYQKVADSFLVPEDRMTKADFEDIERQFTAKALKWFGFNDKEIEGMVDLSDEELRERIQNRERMDMNNGNRQKVIPVGKVEEFIGKGWEYVNTIPGDKAIVKVPD